jgi:glycosyltransferase involved in cell wall biosynthesis
MKVLLVGNYEFDGSISMKIFADALLRELVSLGIDATLIKPRPVFGRIKPSKDGLGKWLGYFDRYVLFPRVLRNAAAKADVVHLCDQGSAMYCFALNGKAAVVTCHDMLAVRGARGELPEIKLSRLNRYFQSWVCRGLCRATCVACISQATFDDASRILGRPDHLRVILDGLNYPFQPLERGEADRRLNSLMPLDKPFLLHVGSNLRRKNRDGVLRMFAGASTEPDLRLVFAGEALNEELVQLAREVGVEGRIIQVVRPNVSILEALYSRALALVFPSHYEGFGWPPIEAQACGCPVVGSNIPPLVEVLGQSAILVPLEHETGMAEAIRSLATDSEFRERMRQAGFENVRSRFQTSHMIKEYVSLYRELAC